VKVDGKKHPSSPIVLDHPEPHGPVIGHEKHRQDLEGARTNPTVATLVGVARALKVTLAELFEHDREV
jgi:hypothetical protein